MIDQLDPAITQLIDAGRARLQDLSETQLRRNAEREQTRQVAIAARLDEAWAAIRHLLPAELAPYVGLCSELQDPDSFEDLYFRLEVPGCSAITLTLQREQTGLVDGQYTYAYKPSTNYQNGIERGTYCVSHLDLVTRTADGEVISYTVGENGHRSYTSDLQLALAVAAEQGQRYLTLEQAATEKTNQIVARRLAQEATTHQIEQRVTAEREALFDLVSDDPVAVTLLKLFIAIKQERAGYAEAIEHLHDTLESHSDHHARQLAEKQHDAVLAVRNARDDAERAQREADDLQTKLERLKHQAQYA